MDKVEKTSHNLHNADPKQKQHTNNLPLCNYMRFHYLILSNKCWRNIQPIRKTLRLINRQVSRGLENNENDSKKSLA